MSLELILEALVSIFSLALTLVGIPAQIAKNYREKRSGQPLTTILIAVGFYASSIAFFAVEKAYLPLISFSIGIIMWLITLVQYFMYYKSTKSES